MIRYTTLLFLQLKNCLGWDCLIGNLCLSTALSTKPLVSNRGHNAHAWHHRFIGFLKFCRLPLNIVYGYSVSVGCMVCSCVF